MRNWDDREREFERNPTRASVKGAVHGGVIAAAVLVVIGLLVGGVWLVRVGFSDTKGKGDSEIVKNEAGNRIRAQEGFLDKYNAVVTFDKNLTLTAEQLAKDPTSVKLQTELTGQKMICNDAVGTYNAAARKFTQQEFRDADLPDRIDGTNADTDCRE